MGNLKWSRAVTEPYSSVIAATFNCEWRTPESTDGRLIVQSLLAHKPDIVCLTETHTGFLSGSGHTIESAANLPCASRRRVSLWSRGKWEKIEADGILATYGMAAGSTFTSFGRLNVVGVCIPYRFAGVRDRPPKQLYELHRLYLVELEKFLSGIPDNLIVVGDFNQRVPGRWQSKEMSELLAKSILDRAPSATQNLRGPDGKLTIDHICATEDLVPRRNWILSNERDGGGRISDHCGVACQFTRR